MPARTGKCIRFGDCAKADSRELQTVAEGQEFVCANPDCAHPLQPVERRTNVPVKPLVGIGALVVVGVVGYLLFRPRPHTAPLASPATPATGTSAALLRLSGSNTIGAALAPALADAFLRQQGATNVKTVPGDKADEVRVEGVLPGESSPKWIEIHAHGSATAFDDLGNGLCDIGMASRKIKPEEVTRLASLGDMTGQASEHVLGLDGIAVIVNKGNSVQTLSKEQIGRAFSGDITDWSQLGGPSGRISVYARDDKSGTFDTFKTLVLGGRPLATDARRLEDSRQLSDLVARDPNGIGFVGLAYVQDAKAVAVSDNGTKPRLPTSFTVSTEDYLLARRLYLYTPANPSNELTRKFVNFAISSQGQDAVTKMGFVGRNLGVDSSFIPSSDAPAEYKRLATGADRMSLNFFFRTGSSDLDNKALVDIDYIVRRLTDLHYTGQNVMLFGFADASGTTLGNDSLSRNRALVVSQQFVQRGVTPSAIAGFGSQLPVASNDTPEGRERNRRVEIWIKK